jgi:hypothetical protein
MARQAYNSGPCQTPTAADQRVCQISVISPLVCSICTHGLIQRVRKVELGRYNASPFIRVTKCRSHLGA